MVSAAQNGRRRLGAISPAREVECSPRVFDSGVMSCAYNDSVRHRISDLSACLSGSRMKPSKSEQSVNLQRVLVVA